MEIEGRAVSLQEARELFGGMVKYMTGPWQILPCKCGATFDGDVKFIHRSCSKHGAAERPPSSFYDYYIKKNK